MIEFININKNIPFNIFYGLYKRALSAQQKNIEAIAISSFDKQKNEVDCRFVNLKFIDDENFIFFSNYNSPKANAFKSHKQVSAVIFWAQINTQIRIKAEISKTSSEYNKAYFKKRSIYKNALAISSMQSKPIASYQAVLKKYDLVKNQKNLTICPEYWGGFAFKPYEIEFWTGKDFRLNERKKYIKNSNGWSAIILEP